ncbi:MAG: hypothetical protein O3C21_01885 [Verrucomicrobia bacterium]|nr:hypothetical protein [Verrucomicrobiota bacterium]
MLPLAAGKLARSSVSRLYGRVLRREEIRTLAGKGVSIPLRITGLVRDPSSHAVTLQWEPGLVAGVVEWSISLTGWQTVAEGVAGTTWKGTIPGDPNEAWLRVRAGLPNP